MSRAARAGVEPARPHPGVPNRPLGSMAVPQGAGRSRSTVPLPTPADDPERDRETGDWFGRPPSDRQLQALAEAVLHGVQMDAAACMGISYQTFKNHVSSVLIRVGARSSVQAAYFLGWVHVPDAFVQHHTEATA